MMEQWSVLTMQFEILRTLFGAALGGISPTAPKLATNVGGQSCIGRARLNEMVERLPKVCSVGTSLKAGGQRQGERTPPKRTSTE
jgi:hypothetical protein